MKVISSIFMPKKKYLLFATNKKAELIEKFEKMIPEEYRKRWNIETGYRNWI